jgi:hypothetical protein
VPDEVALHEHFCPGCARLLAIDVTLAGAEPERDIELSLP